MTQVQAADTTLIRARIHPRALDHMPLLFDATAPTVFIELIQNARRAGASRVDITIESADSKCRRQDPESHCTGQRPWHCRPERIAILRPVRLGRGVCPPRTRCRHGHRVPCAPRLLDFLASARSALAAHYRLADEARTRPLSRQDCCHRRVPQYGPLAIRDPRDVPCHGIIERVARRGCRCLTVRALASVFQRSRTRAARLS